MLAGKGVVRGRGLDDPGGVWLWLSFGCVALALGA